MTICSRARWKWPGHLAACGIGKGTRVGVLVTNRLEFLSCLFGTALAGGVATTISTFFTATELEEVLRVSGVRCCCSSAMSSRRTSPRCWQSWSRRWRALRRASWPRSNFPFLSHLAMVDSDEGHGAIEGWSTFLARGAEVSSELIDAMGAAVAPSDVGLLKFSSGSTGKVKGILSAHRGVCLQLWRWKQWYAIDHGASGADVVGERLFLVGQLCHGAGRHAVVRRVAGAPALVRCRRGAGADGGGKGHLPQRLAAPVGPAGSRAELCQRRSFGDALYRCDDADRAASDDQDRLARTGAGLWQYRDLHPDHGLSFRHAAGSRRRAATASRLPARRSRSSIR